MPLEKPVWFVLEVDINNFVSVIRALLIVWLRLKLHSNKTRQVACHVACVLSNCNARNVFVSENEARSLSVGTKSHVVESQHISLQVGKRLT